MARPGGDIHPFCEPQTTTSRPRASVSSGRQLAPLTKSTAISLPRPLTTAAIAGMSLVTPVEVSLWVTNTFSTAGFSASSRSTSSGSMASPSGILSRSASTP